MSKPVARYVFKEIPNTDEGRLLVTLMKKHLNKQGYSMRVRGQYMNDKARANWKRWEMGQPITLSTHLRVYIEEKKAS